MKVLTGIFGFLLVLCGFHCFFSPAGTYLALAPFIGAVMIVEGVAKVIMWFKLRKEGLANGWLMVSAILSILLGGFILSSLVFSLALNLIITYLAAAWIIVSGITNFMTALQLRKEKKAGRDVGRSWVATLIFSILMIIAGILGFLNPITIALALGMMIGMTIITSGFSLIALAFS